MFLNLKPLLVFSILLALLNGVSGEISKEDLENPHILKLTKFAEKKLAEHWGSDKKPVVLIKASKQKSNKWKYNLTFAAITEDMNEYCDVALIDRHWLMDTQLISLKCRSSLGETFKENDQITMFIKFMKEYKKVYKNRSEFNKRFLIFNSNLEKIGELNAISVTQPGGVVFGVTTFSDLTEEEFLRFTRGHFFFSEPEKPPIQIPDVPLPEEFDWRQKNAVTRVKYQYCNGSGYAFSTTGSVESQMAIKLGMLIRMSEQQLLQCDTKQPNGCVDGGVMQKSFEYIKDNGIVTECEYPYNATNGNQCKLRENSTLFRIDDYSPIEQNETKIAQWLFQNGPVSVAIHVNEMMQHYKSGILRSEYCSNGPLNHGVLIVGYGIDSSKTPFWIVKNSYGEGWGHDGGYFSVGRGFNDCGISEAASTAIINKH